MAGWHLDTKMAQDIVARTMRIIDTNINVMDARGRIIGSGDRERIGELHEGALLVLSQGRVVDIDDAVARHLHGVRDLDPPYPDSFCLYVSVIRRLRYSLGERYPRALCGWFSL